jgi:hypothetical protein
VAVTTNEFLTDKVLKDVRAMVAPLEQAWVTLAYACEFDAMVGTHNFSSEGPFKVEKADIFILD